MTRSLPAATQRVAVVADGVLTPLIFSMLDLATPFTFSMLPAATAFTFS
jgi:hypothetical protein